MNDRYLIREFKATSRIFHQIIEILYYGMQNVVIPWDSITLNFFLSIIITFIIIIIHHFCMEYLLLYTRRSLSSIYKVASILWLQCVVHVILPPMINTTYFHITIIIIIIIIITISFMQSICTYISETNYVPREYSVAAILLLLFMVLI